MSSASAMPAAPLSMPTDVAPVVGGMFVAVVGPSGAGKDTLIAYARQQLAGDPRFVFVRRVITRPSDAGAEDHDTLADVAFDEAEQAGAFAVTWSAHGLKYGLPKSVDDTVRQHRVVIANGSRSALPRLRLHYAHVLVIEVTASAETLAARLAARGRESRGEVLARLARTITVNETNPDVVIDNSGSIGDAGEQLVAALRRLKN